MERKTNRIIESMSVNQAKALGYSAFSQYKNCRHYAGFLPAEEISPVDAMKFFLPPELEACVQLARPRSQARQAWVDGWNDAKVANAIQLSLEEN